MGDRHEAQSGGSGTSEEFADRFSVVDAPDCFSQRRGKIVLGLERCCGSDLRNSASISGFRANSPLPARARPDATGDPSNLLSCSSFASSSSNVMTGGDGPETIPKKLERLPLCLVVRIPSCDHKPLKSIAFKVLNSPCGHRCFAATDRPELIDSPR
jgi:hypothetical protein